MYKCLNCGNVFEEPKRIGHYYNVEYVCPNCDSECYQEVDRCGNPGCLNYKAWNNKLCVACAAELKNKVKNFFDSFTEEEEEQFDEWMDGCSITDREGFSVE